MLLVRSTYEQSHIPNVHHHIPGHLENGLGSPVRVGHAVGSVLLVEESAFAKVAEKWQSIAGDDKLACVDYATIIQDFPGSWGDYFHLFGLRKIDVVPR